MPADSFSRTISMSDRPPASARLSREEFAREFGRSWRALWCLAAGVLNDRGAADDVVQQAAVTAIEHLDRFDPATNFLAWMSQIVRHAALNELRKTRRRRTTPTDPELLDAVTPQSTSGVTASPFNGSDESRRSAATGVTGWGEVAVDQSQFDDRLLAALARLSAGARACLLLRVVVGLPYKELALVMDMPQGTAMSHVDRARRTLREALGSNSPVESTGGDS